MPEHAPEQDREHIPVEKRLSGDFGTPMEVLANNGLQVRQKREILFVWLDDIESQPASVETESLRHSIRQALATLDGEAT